MTNAAAGWIKRPTLPRTVAASCDGGIGGTDGDGGGGGTSGGGDGVGTSGGGDECLDT